MDISTSTPLKDQAPGEQVLVLITIDEYHQMQIDRAAQIEEQYIKLMIKADSPCWPYSQIKKESNKRKHL